MPDDLFSVAGQIVVVSGGSRGIGRAIAEGFATRGARVVITGRNQETLAQAGRDLIATGGDVKTLVCDVARPDAVSRLVDRVVTDYGRIDTLINSAGVN